MQCQRGQGFRSISAAPAVEQESAGFSDELPFMRLRRIALELQAAGKEDEVRNGDITQVSCPS